MGTILNYISVVVLTRDILSGHAQRCFQHLKQSDAEHELIVVQRHLNWSTPGALRQAVAGALGQYVCIVCDDCFVRPDALSRLRRACEDESVGIAGGKLLYPDGSIQYAGAIARQVEGKWYVGHTPSELPPEEIDYLTGALVMMRKSVFEELGGWSNEFKMCYGDTDFCFKARTAGYRLSYDSEPLATHQESTTRKSLGIDGDEEGRQRFEKKWSGHPIATRKELEVV